jgi:multidrug efflux pump subunit AcrA (membrane-fusion protein)
MNAYIYIILILIILSSCGNKDENDRATSEKTQNAGVVTQVIGIGRIEPENDIIQLSSPVTGIVEKILKKENDSVAVGTPILELDHQLEDGKVRQLAAEVTTQAAQITADKAGTEEYRAKYNNAVSEVQRMQRLLTRGAETQQAVDDATANLKSFQSNLKRAEADIEVTESKLEQAKAALHVAEIEREQRTIKSPVNGKILEISTLPGSSVDNRQAFVQIRPTGKTIAICEVDELYADKILVGQKAWIRNVGSLDTLSTGWVYMALSFLNKKSLFTDQSGEKEDRRVRTIKIMLDTPDRLLLNARVECVIDISGNLKN